MEKKTLSVRFARKGSLYSTEWIGGMERWNGAVEWNGIALATLNAAPTAL